MNEFNKNIKAGGRNMTILGVIAISLIIFAMLAPGLIGISVAMLVGVFVIGGGIVRMIWGQFPLSGAWAIGILLGIKLFFVGLIMITGGSVVRSAAVE